MPLSLETELPTPWGWTKVKALENGMELLDELGYPTKVIGVTPAYPARGVELRLGFGKVKSPEPDGVLLCGEGQRLQAARFLKVQRWYETGCMPDLPRDWASWVPATEAQGLFAPETSVEEVAAAGTWTERRHGKNDVRTYLNYSIPVAGSLQLQGGKCPLDPWVAGFCVNFYDPGRGAVKIRAKELPWYTEKFAAAGYKLDPPALTGAATPYKHLWVGVDETLEKQLRVYLKAGLLPDHMFRASERDRMAALAGLMDRWDFQDFKNNVRAGAWFHTNNQRIAEQVCELVRTLGYPATLRAAKQAMKRWDGEIYQSGFYVLWQPLALPFTKPELALRYSHMTYRKGNQAERFFWKIYEASEIEHIMVRDIIVEGRMFAAGKLLVPLRGDDRGEAS